MNVCGFYWNIKGWNFFELYFKFEEIYNLLFEKVDEIVECILILGGIFVYVFFEYIEVSKISEVKNIIEGIVVVENFLVGYSMFI